MVWTPVIKDIVTDITLNEKLALYVTNTEHTNDLLLKLNKSNDVADNLRLTGSFSTDDAAVTKAYVDGLVSPITGGFDSKAPINNPTFTGTVTVPNGEVNTSAVNLGQLKTYLPLSGGTATGAIKVAATPTGDTDLANKQYVDTQVSTKASTIYVDTAVANLEAEVQADYMPISGGTFSGSVSAPTPPTSSNGNEIATTGFVRDLIDEGVSGFATEMSVDTKLDLMAPKVNAQLLNAKVQQIEDPVDRSELVASHRFVHAVVEAALAALEA